MTPCGSFCLRFGVSEPAVTKWTSNYLVEDLERLAILPFA